MSDDRPSGDRTLTWWPFIGAAVIAVIAVGAIILIGSGGENRNGLATDSDGALSCPGTYTQYALNKPILPTAWVPVKGSGVDGTKSLVPDTKPQHVTICHYPASNTLNAAKPALLGHVTVTKNVAAMTKALSTYPKAATTRATCTTPADVYLAGFVFGGGALWVAIPDDDCQQTTNGDFTIAADVRPQIVAAYRTRHWA